jgi:hypothetical protein
MTWLTLRQHRVQLVGLLALAIVLALGIWLVAEYSVRSRAELGIDSCVPERTTIQTPSGPQIIALGNNCAELLAAWQARIGLLRYLFMTVYVVPALVASYVGGPLFATEFERGTHRLAWTQGISRLRWAALKLGIVLAVALVAGVILAAVGGPSRVLMGVGRQATGVRPFEAFDLEGLALVSYMIFGIAAAAFIGAWSRRLVAAMFVGLLVFGLARVAVHNLRPWYQAPVTVPYESLSRVYLVHPGDPTPPDQIPNDAWIVDLPAVDGEGRPVPREKVNELLSAYYRTPRASAPSLTNNDSTYLAEHGVYRRAGYQPADRYWTFQAIEAAIFTALAALFALLTLWRVRSRDA